MSGTWILLLLGITGAAFGVFEIVKGERIDEKLRPKYERGGGWYPTGRLGLFALVGSLIAIVIALIAIAQDGGM